ncbi:MAG: hypothetical protein Q8891_15725 [Bacteroidota bacterium]|nr:hypothetical protein [Bacteroidota bacterium]
MHKNIYIRKFFAVLLLAIFALSNTPTKVLHKLFANHTDFVSKAYKESNAPQLNVTGINCHCESNVVIAPYTPGSLILLPGNTLPAFAKHSIAKAVHIPFSQTFFFELRGPPSQV